MDKIGIEQKSRRKIENTLYSTVYVMAGKYAPLIIKVIEETNETELSGKEKFALVKNKLTNEFKLELPNFILNLLINIVAALIKK